MKILLARIAALNGRNGGMEQVEARMADAMVQRGHKVGILSYDTHEGHPYYHIADSVQLLNLNDFIEGSQGLLLFKCIRELVRPFSRERALHWRNQGRYSYFKDAMKKVLGQFKPDVIVSFDAESSAIFFGTCPDLEIPLITMFHFPTDTAVNWKDPDEREALVKSAFAQVLMNEDVVTLKERLPLANVVRIPNVVPDYRRIADLDVKKPKYTIINVARLAKAQKRQYLLIEAFSRLANEFPAWQVEFWGSEPDNEYEYTLELKRLIHAKGLDNRVFLRGNTNDVLSKYLASDIFAFPSAFEGFGLSMAEAMSAGLPVVAYKTCPAVNELITDGVDGFLMDDGVEPLAEGLRRLMYNQSLRVYMGEKAHETMKKYSPSTVWKQWEDLLSRAVSDRKRL